MIVSKIKCHCHSLTLISYCLETHFRLKLFFVSRKQCSNYGGPREPGPLSSIVGPLSSCEKLGWRGPSLVLAPLVELV